MRYEDKLGIQWVVRFPFGSSFLFLTIFIVIWEGQEDLCIESLFSEKPDKKFDSSFWYN